MGISLTENGPKLQEIEENELKVKNKELEGGYKLFGLVQNFAINKKVHNFDPIQLIF